MDKYAPILYLWTEKGALMHAKSLNTDQAWTAYEILIDDYYRLRTSPLQGMHLDAINEQVTSLLAQIHDVKLNAREAANELKRAKRMAARTERLERKAIAAPPTPTPAVEPQRKPTSVSVEEIILEVLCSLPAGDMVTSRVISRHTLILRKLGAPAIRIVLGRMQETGIIVKEGHGASARYALR